MKKSVDSQVKGSRSRKSFCHRYDPKQSDEDDGKSQGADCNQLEESFGETGDLHEEDYPIRKRRLADSTTAATHRTIFPENGRSDISSDSPSGRISTSTREVFCNFQN
jgi:hypothetical protein